MGLYKQPQSQYWHYRIHVPGSGKARPRTLRGSCRTADREVAQAVEYAMRMAVGRSAPAESLHRMIDALLGTAARPGLPLAAVAETYRKAVETASRDLSPHTMKGRIGAAKRLATWGAAHWPAAPNAEDVDRACAAAFASDLARCGLSPKRRRNLISDLGTIWQELARGRDGMPPNPWPLALPDAKGGERGRAFSREEEMAVLQAADAAGCGWGLASRIARHTGLRYGDVARLRWDQVDLESASIQITPSKTQRWVSSIRLPLPPCLVDAFRVARAQCPQDAPPAVFPALAQAYPHTPWRTHFTPFGDVLAAAGLDRKKYTFHSWRHTFRTRLAEAGVSDEIARRLGGWTSDAMATRYDHDGRAAELRQAVIAAAGGG